MFFIQIDFSFINCINPLFNTTFILLIIYKLIYLRFPWLE
jgi:hypothetical protein